MFHVEQQIWFCVNQIKIYKSDVYQYDFVITELDSIISMLLDEIIVSGMVITVFFDTQFYKVFHVEQISIF